MTGICSECGKRAETRPYGKGGAPICYECGTSPELEERTFAEYCKRFDAAGPLVVIGDEGPEAAPGGKG